MHGTLKASRVSAVALALALAGCSEPPTIELNTAQKAVNDAVAGEAELYAADELAAAKAELKGAQDQIATQSDAFVLTRDYDAAAAALKEASAKAEAALNAARRNKERTIEEVERLAEDTSAYLAATRIAFEQAPRGKGTQEDLAAIGADLDSLTGSLEAAKTLAAGGKYLEAKASLTEAAGRIDSIAAELAQAKQRAS